MKSLQRQLSVYFTVESRRRLDPHRKAREESKRLAVQLGVEIERFSDGGFNVWPPRHLSDELDQFAGDHHASDWLEVLEHLQTYHQVSLTTFPDAADLNTS